jgi:hypothetical protein
MTFSGFIAKETNRHSSARLEATARPEAEEDRSGLTPDKHILQDTNQGEIADGGRE